MTTMELAGFSKALEGARHINNQWIKYGVDFANHITINVDLCEVEPKLYYSYGAIDYEVVELVGPAGGNPNVNITFPDELSALKFLYECGGFDESYGDDLSDYLV